MPVQSIASYISNLISLGIMILISLFLFLIIFLIFKALTGKSDKKGTEEENEKQKGSYAFRMINIRKDPNLLLNLFSLFIFFIFYIIFILLALCFIIIKDFIALKLNLFFIGVIFVFVIATIVYIVKSGIFRQD
ncbi:MAG TPA: hypothetical protein DCY00_02345 [Actinobacteria bacterium]|nr:hypothetical protein [Actinomycetota bacterium]